MKQQQVKHRVTSSAGVDALAEAIVAQARNDMRKAGKQRQTAYELLSELLRGTGNAHMVAELVG